MRNFIFIFGFVLLSACGEEQHPIPTASFFSPKENPKDTFLKQTKVNPAVLTNGCSFLEIFACYQKLGRWTSLIEMTDEKSIERYGKDKLIQAYKNSNLAMPLFLKSATENGDSTLTLNYGTKVFATRKIIRVTVRVQENDSVKLIVNNINSLFK